MMMLESTYARLRWARNGKSASTKSLIAGGPASDADGVGRLAARHVDHEERARDVDRGEERGHDSDRERDREAAHRAGAELEQHQARDQGAQVRVDDRGERHREPFL